MIEPRCLESCEPTGGPVTRRIASLGMYDDLSHELRRANDTLWGAIAERLVAFGLEDVPRHLERTIRPSDVWLDERLLFAQVGASLFATRRRGTLRLVGTPDYSLPGCALGHHTSFIVVHARSAARGLSDLRGARVAVNELESTTGLLLEDAVATLGDAPFFAETVISGSHRRSVALVALGSADVAAIDCISYAHIARASPEMVSQIRVIGRTGAVPCLPFVVPSIRGEETASFVARALREAVSDPRTAGARRVLGLVGIRDVSVSVYEQAMSDRRSKLSNPL